MKTMTDDHEFQSKQTGTRNIIRIVLGAALLLLVPAVAMQFTNDVNWGPLDFVHAGALLIGTGIAYELISRKVRTTRHRLIVGGTLSLAFLLIWAELAVGIIWS
jgi:hypothetical protein